MGNTQPEFGVVGLGRIGGGLALQALEKGMRVTGFTLGGVRPELLQAGLTEVREPAGFRDAMAAPRAVFLYIPAGPVVDDTLDGLAGALEPGDIVVDGGNSYWGDSIRRQARLRERGIHLVDVGTSGGVEGARRGACFMAGGEAEAVERVAPILRELAVPGGYAHAGPPGAGSKRTGPRMDWTGFLPSWRTPARWTGWCRTRSGWRCRSRS